MKIFIGLFCTLGGISVAILTDWKDIYESIGLCWSITIISFLLLLSLLGPLWYLFNQLKAKDVELEKVTKNRDALVAMREKSIKKEETLTKHNIKLRNYLFLFLSNTNSKDISNEDKTKLIDIIIQGDDLIE